MEPRHRVDRQAHRRPGRPGHQVSREVEERPEGRRGRDHRLRPAARLDGHNGGPIEVTVTIRLQPTAAGTRLSSDFDARPHGWFRLAFPLFLVKISKEEAANQTHIKTALERRAASGQAS